VHGGPHRAVCLFGMEVIERLQAEGHPVQPGGVGENLTTWGVEWSLLPVGTRVRVGDAVELEISSSTTPCATQIPNFSDGKFNRILIDKHPSDSRMYARVVMEGEVKAGDSIVVLPAPDEARAQNELLLKRLDRASQKADVASWRAAAQCGFDIDIVEDGEIAMASAAHIEGPAFNHAMGFARLPNLHRRALDFFDAHRKAGWIWTDEPPFDGAQAEATVGAFAAEPGDVPEDADGPAGLTVREIGPDDAAAFIGVYGDDRSPRTDDEVDPWPSVYARLADWPHRFLFLAELDGRPVGAASLHTSAQVGWLRGGVVAPDARGHGIQRALIAARARRAIELRCDLLGSWAEPEGPSATNLRRMGLRVVGERRLYPYRPHGA
jgi:MOSC domain-containing protein YiiM